MTETKHDGRVQFRISSGFYGAGNDILIDVPAGMEAEGRQRAKDLLDMIQPMREFTLRTQGYKFKVEARTESQAWHSLAHWWRYIEGSI